MEIKFLDGPSLAEELPKLISQSTRVDVAIAYVKESGLQALMESFNSLIKRGG